METRERINETSAQVRPAAPVGGGNLQHVQAQTNDLLAAGRAIISRALSGDSERFLEANRQAGGE